MMFSALRHFSFSCRICGMKERWLSKMMPRNLTWGTIGIVEPLSVMIGFLFGLLRGRLNSMLSDLVGENLNPLWLHHCCKLLIVPCIRRSASAMFAVRTYMAKSST